MTRPSICSSTHHLSAEQQATLFKALADCSHNVVGIKDRCGRYIYVNAEYSHLFHQALESFIGHTDQELFPLEMARQFRANDLLVQAANESITVEEEVMVDGRLHHFLSVKFPIFDQDGKLYATGVIATDISQIKLTKQALWASEERFRLAFEYATMGMSLLDLEGKLVQVNPSGCEMLGYHEDELQGQNLNLIAHPDDLEICYKFIRRALAGEISGSKFEMRLLHKSRRIIQCQISASLARDSQGTPLYFISHINDVTASRRIEAELKKLATTDPLTGVANRRPFLDRMQQELSRLRRFGTPASCLMLDFDFFKQINDQWGHSGGDAVLRYFSRVCRRRLRSTDLLARLGGEEFAVLMPGTTLAGALQLAEQLRHWIATHPLPQGSQQIHFTISVGVTELLPTDRKPDEVLARTDSALYRAKDLGRNRVEIALPEPQPLTDEQSQDALEEGGSTTP